MVVVCAVRARDIRIASIDVRVVRVVRVVYVVVGVLVVCVVVVVDEVR